MKAKLEAGLCHGHEEKVLSFKKQDITKAWVGTVKVVWTQAWLLGTFQLRKEGEVSLSRLPLCHSFSLCSCIALWGQILALESQTLF